MKIYTPNKLENGQYEAIKRAWENGPDTTALKEEFGNDYDSYKAYFENDEHFKKTGEIKPKW